VEWLDKIPIHWTGTVLKRWVETKITDGPHETPEHVEDGIPFVSAEAVQRGSINFDSRWGNISRELHERYSKKLLPKRNDIFLVKSGATTGKVAFVDIDMEFNVWSPLALIRANTKMVLPKFLFVIMQSDYVQKQIQMTWTAGTQPNISMGTIEELYVVAPPVEEQEFVLERLYNQLKNIDRLTVLAQKTIENLYERRASLIASVVSGQLQIAVKM
jgi:type I restriction enzyme S subunit